MTSTNETLTALGEAVRAVAAAAGASVVQVGRDRRGCGVIIGDGLVATNAHNIRNDTIAVHVGDADAVQGSVLGTDIEGDLAVIGAETGDAPALEWADAGDLELGDAVFALGAGGRVTVGLVTAVDASFRGPRGRQIRGSVEHTAPLRPGSSGGPIVDGSGKVLGINTHRLGEGFYLAQPAAEEMMTRVADLAEGRSPLRRRLGVAIAPAGVARKLRQSVGLDERDGLLVRHVSADSPAEAAGIAVGDLLIDAGGVALESGDALHAVIDDLADDAELTIKLVRGADDLEVTVTF